MKTYNNNPLSYFDLHIRLISSNFAIIGAPFCNVLYVQWQWKREFYIFHTEHALTRTAKQQTNTCARAFIACRINSITNPTCFCTLRYQHQGWRLKYKTRPINIQRSRGVWFTGGVLYFSRQPWWGYRSVPKHVGFISGFFLRAITVRVYVVVCCFAVLVKTRFLCWCRLWVIHCFILGLWSLSRSRKEFLGGVGVGVGKNVPIPTPTSI
jgi:hypothetical protein